MVRAGTPAGDGPGGWGALNAWAREFFHDPRTGRYHLIWSSVVEPGVSAEGRDFEHVGQDHRIWHCSTGDFRTFSPSGLFFDPGRPVIQSTVQLLDGGGFLMAYKDERGTNDRATVHKDIHLTGFDTPGGPFIPTHGPVGPGVVEGPLLFGCGQDRIVIFDHCLEGRYGGPAQHWRPDLAADPARPSGRHASRLGAGGPAAPWSRAAQRSALDAPVASTARKRAWPESMCS